LIAHSHIYTVGGIEFFAIINAGIKTVNTNAQLSGINLYGAEFTVPTEAEPFINSTFVGVPSVNIDM
jgi:hypothetical protein